MMLRVALLTLGVSGCASVSGAPESLRPESVFLGRITATAESFVMIGDLAAAAKVLKFQVLGQPGVFAEAFDYAASCEPGDIGDDALLVFVRSNPNNSALFVYACPRVDAGTARDLLEHEREVDARVSR